jgi:HEAT repeat protein
LRESLALALAGSLLLAAAACVGGNDSVSAQSSTAIPDLDPAPRSPAAQQPGTSEAAGNAATSAASLAGGFLGRPASSWIQQLEQSWDASQRMAAVTVLTDIGPEANGVTAALIEALGDRNPTVRAAAVSGLQQFAPLVGPDLGLALYGHKNHSVRAGCALALSPIAASDPAAMESLVRALSDRSGLVRRVSAGVIGGTGDAARIAVPALIEALRDEEILVRLAAAESLGLIGPGARAAIPALEAAAETDLNERVSAAATEALSRIRS